MATIITRFTISSASENSIGGLEESLVDIPCLRRKKGEAILLADGRNSGRLYSRSEFVYKYEFLNITDIEICNDAFMKEWGIKKLRKLTNSGFKLELNYEIIVYDYNYPSFYFQPHFSTILGNSNIEFSFYFYND